MEEQIERFGQLRAELLSTVGCFPAERVGEVAFGEWSLQSVLAHLAGWDGYFTQILALLRRGEKIPYWGSMKKFNQASVQQRQGLDWEQVHREFVQAGDEFIRQYSQVEEGVLDRRFWEGRSYTPASIVEINAHHYGDHLAQIRKLLVRWEAG